MYRRYLAPRFEEALGDTPVVVMTGARQTGKTTLVQALARAREGTRYVTLDDATTLASAESDPTGFVRRGGGGLLVVDEVQKAPGLLPAIKVEVDRDRRPGRYVLTGSARVLTLPQVSESLAGRMEIMQLRPLAQSEIEGADGRAVERLFGDAIVDALPIAAEGDDLRERILRGGFPEVLERAGSRRRDAWFGSYLTAILQRDVRDLANIEGLTQMPRLLSILAARSASLVNKAELSRATGLPYTTLERYLALFEVTFLYEPVPAWAANLSKRLVRSPKAALLDSGLAGHLTGASLEGRAGEAGTWGGLAETFVVAELRAQASWSDPGVTVSHFRSGQSEVDVVMEDRAGRIIGVEVKLGATIGRKDTAGLKALAAAVPERFLRGVVFYGGEGAVPLGEKIVALPIRWLWAT